MIETARKLGVEIRNGLDIWGVFGPRELIGTIGGRVQRFNPERLVVATGAYERGVPIPGWTLPGVMTTGAAQTLWRSYRRLPGKRVLIAGNGPLNMQVASELVEGGADIAAVVELAQVPAIKSLSALARMLAASPRLVLDGLRYRTRLGGVSMIYGSAVVGVEASTRGLTARVAPYSAGAAMDGRTFEVDAVCLGYGFQPSNEILRALECKHTFDLERGQFVTSVDADGRTSVEGVYAVGDCTGLGGARIALAEGKLVGAAVAADLGHTSRSDGDIAAARSDRDRHRRFQKALWSFYAAPRLNLELATPSTIVCRCEEVTRGTVETALADGKPSIGDLKRATRAGMGPCQGRYCGVLLTSLLAEKQGLPVDDSVRFAPRMPVKPVRIADIARYNL